MKTPTSLRASLRIRDRSRGGWGAAWPLAVVLAAATLLGGCRRRPVDIPDVAPLVEAVRPAVVRVRGRGGMAQTEGSGFFIRGASGEPLLVTNHHVVWGAADVVVERSDGVTEPAALIAVDAATDLALLRPGSRSVPATLSFGDDAELQVGSWLVALGSPEGVFNAASLGILSARGLVPRATLPAERLVDHLFIDSALGAGGSGGPIVDLAGRVVGVSLAVMGNSRLGVALPASLAAVVVKDLERDGRSVHGFAGVALGDEQRSDKSVRVTAVVSGGPAAEAQLQVGDRIDRIDGQPLDGPWDLRRRLFMSQPGATARLRVARGTEQVDAVLHLQPLPADARAN
jgi:S1-C subfamily serine protease